MKYSRSQLAKAYVSLLDKYPSKDLAKGFAPLLLQQGTGRDIEKFGEEVAYVSSRNQRTVLATVTSARKLSKDIQKNIALYIQRAEGMDHTHVISYEIDPTLIGGAVIQTATHTYTFSVTGKIQSIL
jgi:F0F1-type ATP synthase delta subunit